jgi:hypothetical protein
MHIVMKHNKLGSRACDVLHKVCSKASTGFVPSQEK